MSQENVAVIAGMYAGFAAGDVAAVLGPMDPQIEWNEAENFPYADRNPYIGPDAVAEGVFGRIGAEWEGFGVTEIELVDGGDVVLRPGSGAGANGQLRVAAQQRAARGTRPAARALQRGARASATH